MKALRIPLALAGLLLLGVCVVYRAPHVTRAEAGQDKPTPSRSKRHGASLREMDLPYYSLRDGFRATLRLVSDCQSRWGSS